MQAAEFSVRKGDGRKTRLIEYSEAFNVAVHETYATHTHTHADTDTNTPTHK